MTERTAYEYALAARKIDRKGRYKQEVVVRTCGSGLDFVYAHKWIPWWRR